MDVIQLRHKLMLQIATFGPQGNSTFWDFSLGLTPASEICCNTWYLVGHLRYVAIRGMRLQCTWQLRKPVTEESAPWKAKRGSWNALDAQLAPAEPSFLWLALPEHISKRQLDKSTAESAGNNCVRGSKRQQEVARKAAELAPTSHRSESEPQTFRHCSSSCKDQSNLLFHVMRAARSCCL